jgi:uncharacterized protein (DUF2384 family)
MNSRSLPCLLRASICAAVQRRTKKRIQLTRDLTAIDEKLLRRAVEAFGSVESAGEWLVSEAFGPRGQIPVVAAKSKKGLEEVLQLIIRIEHGILS